VRLIVHTERSRVWQNAVEELENAVLSDGRVRPARVLGKHEAQVVHLLFKLQLSRSLTALRHVRGRVFERTGCDYFVVMMGFEPRRCVPDFYLPGRKSLYMFDAWPAVYDGIAKLVSRWGIQDVFVSSSQAAAALNDLVPHCRFSWVAEGVDPDLYTHRPYAARDIDVVQIGRKHDAYHESIVAPLLERGRCYRYEQTKGEIVFPTREQFVDGLARSKVSICFPCNLTHPQRSGDTETMTQRYLQSLVSKCLVVGHAPKEMVSLFGYNPVVEADMNDPAGQLLSILDNFHDYVPLIEMNYRTAVEEHTWTKRWQTIASAIFP
jgi:hypothetical protein